MLEKTTRINNLLDFYESLLTEKQQSYMTLYFVDDYSLSEIANIYGVSRNAVHNTLKATEGLLEDYESKLNLFAKYEQRQILLEKIKSKTTNDEIHEIIDEIENID